MSTPSTPPTTSWGAAQPGTQPPSAPAPDAAQTLAAAQAGNAPLSTTTAPSPMIQKPWAATPDRDLPKESWGARIYHGVLGALGGTNQVSFQRDPKSGQMIATQAKIGPGQQWKNIIAGALTGYAGAAATGAHGPGSTSAKMGAGFQAGQQLAQQQYDQKRQEANEDYNFQAKAALQSANLHVLTLQGTKLAFENSQAELKATQEDADREASLFKAVSEGGEGSKDLGVLHNFAEVQDEINKDPDLHAKIAGGGSGAQIVSHPHYRPGPDGEPVYDGIHYAVVMPTWLKQKNDTPFDVINENGDKQHVPAQAVDNGTMLTYQIASGKNAAAKANADAKNALAGKKETEVEARDRETRWWHRAELEQRRSEFDQRERDKKYKFGNDPQQDADYVDMIGTGHIVVNRLDQLLSRNPELGYAISQKYPGFDSGKAQSYPAMYKEFTSGKIGTAMNSADTVLKHLRELQALNTNGSLIPGTSAYTSYMNLANKVGGELSQFYGEMTIPGIEKNTKDIQSMTPWQRNAAILGTARAFGDKLMGFQNQWKNGAPSAVYEAKMPFISQDSMNALESLSADKAKEVKENIPNLAMNADQPVKAPGAGAATPPPPAANQAPPISMLKEGVDRKFKGGMGTWTLQNGKPVRVGD